MDRDPGLQCFDHCSYSRVFFLQLPECCPVCRTPLAHLPELLPFRVPYPFVRASQYPRAVLIKPTFGDFLQGYEAWTDLHIGVTCSRGRVAEYDREGLHRGTRTDSWGECLVVHQAPREDEEVWDSTLASILKHPVWTTHRYNEETFNCYTFVLAFIKCLKAGEMSEVAASKTKFCESFVSPKVSLACKYIALYRRVKDSGYFVARPPPPLLHDG